MRGKIIRSKSRSINNNNNTNNNDEGNHLNYDLSRRYEDEKTKNKNISENEIFFTKILSHQLMSRIWPENGILGILIEDVRKLTKLNESQKLVFEENSFSAKSKSFKVDLKQKKQIIRNNNNNSNKNKNNYSSKNDNDNDKKKNDSNNDKSDKENVQKSDINDVVCESIDNDGNIDNQKY